MSTKGQFTKSELKILRGVERQIVEDGGFVNGGCFANGQRVTMRDERLLYHEGYIVTPFVLPNADADGRFRHAWNSINGKLVDFSLPWSFEVPQEAVDYYKADHTFTQDELFMASLKRGLQFTWMSEEAA